MRKRKGNQQGFTVVELFVVIGIIFVLGAIVTPSIMRILPGMRLREGAQEVFLALETAKMEAIRRNKQVEVRFESVDCGKTVPTDGSEYQIYYLTPDGQIARMPDGKIDYIKMPTPLPHDVALCEKSADGKKKSSARARFGSNGLSSPLGGSVYLRNNQGGEREVAVSWASTGAVKIARVGQK